MAYGWRLEAVYESGYVLTEDGADHSPYDPGRNVFHAILNARPTEAGHGPMIRFSLIGAEERFDIDWTDLPTDARPIYYRTMRRSFAVDGSSDTGPVCESHHFGWQGTVEGRHVQELREAPAGG